MAPFNEDDLAEKTLFHLTSFAPQPLDFLLQFAPRGV